MRGSAEPMGSSAQPVVPGNRFVFPAWTQAGAYIDLRDVLPLIPDNGWTWTVFCYEGQGRFSRWTEPELEALTERDEGLAMSWRELKDFGSEASQSQSGFFVATDAGARLAAESVLTGDCRGAQCCLELFDTSEWSVFFGSSPIDRASFARGVADLMAAGGGEDVADGGRAGDRLIRRR